jgi:signal transduction histidine kinase
MRERRFALATVALILVALAAIAPFASIQLSPLNSFTPSLQAIISISSIVTAILLFGQLSVIGSRALLVLAGGYLFVAAIVVFAPVSPAGLLGAEGQSAASLYIFWHFGFPAAVIGYAHDLPGDARTPARRSLFSPIFSTVIIVIASVCFLTRIATAKELFLPVFGDATRFAHFSAYSTATDMFLAVLALVLLWKRGRSTLDMWLSVAICASFAELVINIALVSDRFTLGWYSACAFSVLASTIVMTLMLAQTFALNATLMRMSMMLQRERSNRLANLEAVVASIAHDIRQPLATISIHGAGAQRCLDCTPPKLDKAGTSLEAMVNASMRVSEAFTSIRGLFSKDDQEKQPVDVTEVAAEALDLLREELNANGIEASVQQTAQLPPVVAHKGQLREVILNLIQNAIDAMSEISRRPRILRITTDRHGNGAIVISVGDTGPGIDPEKVKNIFDPFFSTKEKRMGLGLAICKSFARHHCGQLSVSSEVGCGARFQLILPTNTAEQKLPEQLARLKAGSDLALSTKVNQEHSFERT